MVFCSLTFRIGLLPVRITVGPAKTRKERVAGAFSIMARRPSLRRRASLLSIFPSVGMRIGVGVSARGSEILGRDRRPACRGMLDPRSGSRFGTVRLPRWMGEANG